MGKASRWYLPEQKRAEGVIHLVAISRVRPQFREPARYPFIESIDSEPTAGIERRNVPCIVDPWDSLFRPRGFYECFHWSSDHEQENHIGLCRSFEEVDVLLPYFCPDRAVLLQTIQSLQTDCGDFG